MHGHTYIKFRYDITGHKINYSRFSYSTRNGLRNKLPKKAKDNKVTKEAIKIVKEYLQKESTVLKKIIKCTQFLSTAVCNIGPDIFVDVL